MLIISQCGTRFFNSVYFAGAWIKSYDDKQFLLKAIFANKEVILGVYDSKDEALASLNKLLDKFKNEWLIPKSGNIYQV